MLLRRVTQHVKAQNWFAVALDFAIVVAGILIAFQITNWNEERAENNLKSLVEKRLIADFEIIDQELDAAVERMERQLINMEVWRQALRRGSTVEGEKESILNGMAYGASYPSFTSRSATYQELQTSGRLDLIANEKFRVALSKYDNGAQQRRFNLSEIRAVMLSTGYSASIYAETAPLKRDENGEFQILPLVGYDFEAMVSDENYLRQVEAVLRLQTWVHSNIRVQRRDVDTVLEIIKELK